MFRKEDQKLKSYFTDYVNHILRFYVRRIDGDTLFRSEPDKLNYIAADRVMKKLDSRKREMIRYVYLQYSSNVLQNVRYISRTRGYDEKELWLLISDVTKKIAKERGLI